ncbi:hypothetical protein [Pseudomonas sp. NA-150]|uniref:hypothetical protein n=1 Tax=Pseudomonas sp. NA-150 TaxID=3367525 RepID=UPI0037C922B7
MIRSSQRLPGPGGREETPVDRNFQCLTIADACASGDRYAHDAALYMVTVENGIFGALTDAAAVLEGLARLNVQTL